MHRRTSLVAAAAVAAGLLLSGSPSGAAAAKGAATVTPAGYDISYPQCPAQFPKGALFGVVGVTNGLPWSSNPCLGAEYDWAASLTGPNSLPPAFYANTANPAPRSSYFWPTSGSKDPVLCINSTVTTDPGCAYDYGYHAAANAFSVAVNALTPTHGAAATALVVNHNWWLDVETGNSWNGDGYSNAADIQGWIDYLRAQGIPQVGVYSTGYQWNTITGGYTITNSSTYASHWQAEFTSPNGIAPSPDWLAGASNVSQAASFCTQTFTGAKTTLVQYPSGGFDADRPC